MRRWPIDRRGLFLLVCLFAATASAAGAEQPVYGPARLKGKGQQVVETQGFKVQDPSGPFLLRVRNTGITDATVWLNRQPVLAPGDFGAALIERPVTLLAKNEIRYSYFGAPAFTLTVEIVRLETPVSDTTPPTIAASLSPLPNAAGWNNSPVTVTFTCADAGSAVATCPAPVVVTSEGANQVVSGTAVDAAGNQASSSVAVNLDQGPPDLAVQSPPEGTTVNELTQHIVGTVSDLGSGITSVSCNNTAADRIESDFTCDLTLLEGANDIIVSATDAAGNSTSVTRHITATTTDADGVAPDVEDGAPNDGDGNFDEIRDSLQTHVVSLPNAHDGRYVTLAFLPGTTPMLVSALLNPSPGDTPADSRFPLGFFHFRIAGVTRGGSTMVSMYLPEQVPLSTVYRYGPTPDNPSPHWYEFGFDGTTGAELRVDEIRLHFVDGARGDDDLLANGEIVDAVAPTSGPCPSDPTLEVAPGQTFECSLPPIGDTPVHTWELGTNVDGSTPVLPAGVAFAQDGDRWFLRGTVAPAATLTTTPLPLVGRGVFMGFPVEAQRFWTFDVRVPIRVWTQNTILRPDHLIDGLEDLPHGSIAVLIAAFIFGLPGGVVAEALHLADENYHSRVANDGFDNQQRANLMLQRVPAFDLVALQEVFNDEERDQIIRNPGYWTTLGPAEEGFSVLPPELPVGSSGLALLTKRRLSPPVQQLADSLFGHRAEIFEECNRALDDCLSNKGFTFDIVHFGTNPNHYIYIVNSHTQSTIRDQFGEFVDDRRVREDQFQQIADFIAANANPLHPVLIVGDLNVDSVADRGEWVDMLDTLGVDVEDDFFYRFNPNPGCDSPFPADDCRFSFDLRRSAYARYWATGDRNERLDYVLVRQGTRYRIEATSATLADEASPTSLCEERLWGPVPPFPDTRCYFSDHFGIHARLRLVEDLPFITILSPGEGDQLLQGSASSLQAFAGHPDRRRSDLFTAITWTSDVEGQIGSRGSLSWRPQVAGTHILTASVVDFDGVTASSSVTVFVRPDTDRDGLSDDDEAIHGTNPNIADTDGDGLSDGEEVVRHRTDPLDTDTDNDGVTDGDEVRAGSSPLVPDTDRDGLPDAVEIDRNTDPSEVDTDRDGVWDGAEIILGSLPRSAASLPGTIRDGTLFAQTLGYLAVIDRSNGMIGHVGQPGSGLGFGLNFDNQQRLFVSAITGLVTADPLRATPTPVGPFRTSSGEEIDVINLAFNTQTGTLWGVEEGPAPNFLPTAQLVSIDRATGQVTRQGLAPEPINALAFNATGRLVAALRGADGIDRLAELDAATGAVTQAIGPIGFQPVFGLAFEGPALWGTAVNPGGIGSKLLLIDVATGQGTPIFEFDQIVFDLTFRTSGSGIGFTHLEDFSSDTNPSQPGFATSVFVHTADLARIVHENFFRTPAPYPSSPHALFLTNSPDIVTFNLNPGSIVTAARVRANGFFGAGRVEIIGAGDTKSVFVPQGPSGWLTIEASSTELGASGRALGPITQIRLTGGEALFDQIEILVLPPH